MALAAPGGGAEAEVHGQRTQSRGGGDTEGQNRVGASSTRCRSTDLKSRRRRAVSGALSMELALLPQEKIFVRGRLILVLRLQHERLRGKERECVRANDLVDSPLFCTKRVYL
jgi:hypothetical protein